MSNDKSAFHIDNLYTVAEDLYRFAPWESDFAPFILMDPAHPDAYVLVVMENDKESTSDIRLILGTCGIRAWLAEQNRAATEESDDFSEEEFVSRYDGYYLEVGYNMPTLNNYEKRLLEGRPYRITFRRQRPGYELATIVDSRDYIHLERYLRAILQLLTHQLLGDVSNQMYRLQFNGSKELLHAAAFSLDTTPPQQTTPFVLTRAQWLAPLPAVIDEFTNARVKYLPRDGRIFELYFFYLPMLMAGKTTIPRSFFLVDLESGFIEWNNVVLSDPGWQEKLLRQLWKFFLEEGARPQEILIQNIGVYCALAEDIASAGIRVERITHSYVGQELLDSYLQAAHLKLHQVVDIPSPPDPY